MIGFKGSAMERGGCVHGVIVMQPALVVAGRVVDEGRRVMHTLCITQSVEQHLFFSLVLELIIFPN